ncbi:MAG: hemerythrin domain-containing protein [Myxococcales bacterium]|nr:hemerythrin domain-containing protein [Myxococcales bacterium]
MSETIFDALRESHQRQRALCRKLLRSKPGGVDRRSVVKALRCECAAHAAAEERFLYAVILLDDAGLQSSRHAIAEHHDIDELAQALTATDTSSRAWLRPAKSLSKSIHHHLKEEESCFFQASGRILSATKKRSLARQYEKDYARMLEKLLDD